MAQRHKLPLYWRPSDVRVLHCEPVCLPEVMRQRVGEFVDARRQGYGWFWLLDDDIQKFFCVVQGRTVQVPIVEALMRAQAVFAGAPDIAQAGLEYQQFAWAAKRAYVRNSYCDVCVAIHADRTRMLTFCPEVNLKTDRDFTLQVLASGYQTLRVSQVAFAAPQNGSNRGGLAPCYAVPGAEAADCLAMVQRWGETVCEITRKPSGRTDVKIHWKQMQAASPTIL